MNIKEIKVNSIISKSKLPEADYVINPYVGCMHSCIYCYARFMKRFTGHDEKWGEFIDVKINAYDFIESKKQKYDNKSIFMSSVTDPYIPIEKKYEITKKILERILLFDFNIKLGIQTKSCLVLRDLDIIKNIKDCEIGFTITTLDDRIRKEIESYTSKIEERIEALYKIKEKKIKNYVFIGPILPYITDWKGIIEKTKGFVAYYYFENLNVRSVWDSIEKWLNEKREKLIVKYKNIYFNKNNYWDEVEKEIKDYCSKNNINYKIFFHHNSIKKTLIDKISI